MEAVVFKNHVTHTADRAFLVRKHVPGIKVFGGITLNHAVGGLNPQAVEWMWRMQGGFGRVVWFPTFDADNHVKRTGQSSARAPRRPGSACWTSAARSCPPRARC